MGNISLITRTRELLKEAEEQTFEERIKAQETKLKSARDVVGQEHPTFNLNIEPDKIEVNSETTDLTGRTRLVATKEEDGWHVDSDSEKHGFNPEGLLFDSIKKYKDQDIEQAITAFVNSWTTILTNK